MLSSQVNLIAQQSANFIKIKKMTNQNRQNFENHFAEETLPSQKVYSFRDLPKDVRDKLLQMQNTDGDFLRTSEKSSVLAQVIFLFLVLNIFGGFVSAFDFSKTDAVKIIFFSIGCVLFALWTAYFGRNIYRMFAFPIKNHISDTDAAYRNQKRHDQIS